MTPSPDIIPAADVARMLGVSRQRVHQLRKLRAADGVALGRTIAGRLWFEPGEVEQLRVHVRGPDKVPKRSRYKTKQRSPR